jgi:thiamine monophosphate synthase
VIAIGGITPERVGEVRRAGARGVAVISSILAADSPGEATGRFLKALA